MIACLYPRPSTAIAAACAAAVFTAFRLAVGILWPPESHFLLFGAFDASLAHFLIVLDLCFRELAVLAEDDVEA